MFVILKGARGCRVEGNELSGRDVSVKQKASKVYKEKHMMRSYKKYTINYICTIFYYVKIVFM